MKKRKREFHDSEIPDWFKHCGLFYLLRCILDINHTEQKNARQRRTGTTQDQGQETQDSVRRTAVRYAFLRSRVSVACMQMNPV